MGVKKYQKFREQLCLWHKDIDRDLPWKETNDPYKIWISEIILQQTRVKQGKEYYQRMIQIFPTIQDLARASQDQILSVWKGLGYYSRARNMHYAAKQIVNDFDGVFPVNHKDILKLKGVGKYTAAAIASFAYNLPYAVLDGNVFRVLSRVFGIDSPIDTTEGKKLFQELAQNCLDTNHPSEYNQAIMDFGALHCTSSSPSCNICPFSDFCDSQLNGTQTILPVKSKKIKVKERFFHFLVFTRADEILMVKRKERDIWQGLYQLPLIESDSALAPDSFLEQLRMKYKKSSLTSRDIQEIGTSRQRLTHQLIFGSFYQVNFLLLPVSGEWKSRDELIHLGTPKIIDDFLKKYIFDL